MEIDDNEWLFRRVRPRSKDSMTGLVKANSFNLRQRIDERALSFYRASTDPSALLKSAPDEGRGWGVVRVRAGTMRELGFVVTVVEDYDDPSLGALHVEAATRALDETGQIQATTRDLLARAAQWVIEPGR